MKSKGNANSASEGAILEQAQADFLDLPCSYSKVSTFPKVLRHHIVS